MPPAKKKAVAKKAPPKTKSIEDKEADSFINSLAKEGMLGDVKKKIDFISTGSWVINRLIGDGSLSDKPGGIPRGSIVEIFGGEGCGKTTIGLHICKQALMLGETVVYADFEQSLRTQFKYIENIGIDPSPPKFIHLIPKSFEDGVNRIGKTLVKLKPAVIIIDSVTTMLPKTAYDSDADETFQIGLHAKLTGSFLNWIQKRLVKYNCALVLLNQIRANIKTDRYAEGPNEVTSGGNAIRFYPSVRLKLKAMQKKDVSETSSITGDSEKKYVNQTIKVMVMKNKLDMPFKSGPIYLTFGQGIDNVLSLIALAVAKKIIKKGGSWYEWEDPNGTLSFKLQGDMNVKKHLEKNPEILEIIKPFLVPTQDDKEMDELQETLELKGIDNLTIDEKEQLKEIRKVKGLAVDDLEFSEEELEDIESLNDLTSGMPG